MQNPFTSLHDAPVGAWARPQVQGMNDGRVRLVGMAALRCIAPLFGSVYAYTALTGQSVSARGGKTPYTYSIGSGTLPVGLSLNGATGVISGTPQVIGSYYLIFAVTDARGVKAYSASCELIVLPVINSAYWDEGFPWNESNWS